MEVRYQREEGGVGWRGHDRPRRACQSLLFQTCGKSNMQKPEAVMVEGQRGEGSRHGLEEASPVPLTLSKPTP